MTYANSPKFIFDYNQEIDNPRYAIINDIHYESASASSNFSISEDETDLIIVKKETTMLNHIKQYFDKIIDLVKSFL